MALVHFGKRTIECLCVHIFSKSTKSLGKLIWEMAYTWLFFGAGIGYYLFHPDYKAPIWMTYFPGNTMIYYYIILGLFLFF